MTHVFLTGYIAVSTVIVAAGLSNLSNVYNVYLSQVKEERLLNNFDVDRFLAMDLDGDGVQKAECLGGVVYRLSLLKVVLSRPRHESGRLARVEGAHVVSF